MKGILWSIRKPHTDNIKSGKKWDEIRKRIPKDLSPLVPNYIYETKANGGCGKVIGEFRVSSKIYLYAYEEKGQKHLGNTAFIMPALSDEELFNYLCNGKKSGQGWALRIDKLKIYDKPKELSEFYSYKECSFKDWGDVDNIGCWEGVCESFDRGECKYGNLQLQRPPQSWCYIEDYYNEDLGE